MIDGMSRSNTCLNSRRREIREAVIFEEVMAEIFSEFMKDSRPQTKEDH